MTASSDDVGVTHRQKTRNPVPTVDVILFDGRLGVLLIRRKNPPPGWALPGGFVDYGETCEQAAVREMREETGLRVDLLSLHGVYSDPARDERMHTMSVVYVGQARDVTELNAGDDAAEARWFSLRELPELAFDHGHILADFVRRLDRLNTAPGA